MHAPYLFFLPENVARGWVCRNEPPVHPQVHDRHPVDGQGTRLVRRKEGNRSQGIDRSEVLHQDIIFLKTSGGERQEHRHSGRQALRHERHEDT